MFDEEIAKLLQGVIEADIEDTSKWILVNSPTTLCGFDCTLVKSLIVNCGNLASVLDYKEAHIMLSDFIRTYSKDTYKNNDNKKEKYLIDFVRDNSEDLIVQETMQIQMGKKKTPYNMLSTKFVCNGNILCNNNQITLNLYSTTKAQRIQNSKKVNKKQKLSNNVENDECIKYFLLDFTSLTYSKWIF